MLDIIIHGDCREELKNMKDNSVDVVFTSPPYNRTINDKYEEYSDDIDYANLLNTVTDECLRVAKDKVIINIGQHAFNKREVFSWIGRYACNIGGVVTWVKNNPQPSMNYRKDENTRSVTNCVEHFYVLTEDGKEFRSYGKEECLNVIRSNVNTDTSKGHGAIMKMSIAEWWIEHFTRKGDLVLDPFMGTGTTAIACKNLGRNYIGIEQSKKYIDISHKRISEETKQIRMAI